MVLLAKMIDRRLFLRSLIGGVVGAAAVRTWPFRVYSFAAPESLEKIFGDYVTSRTLPSMILSKEEFISRYVSLIDAQAKALQQLSEEAGKDYEFLAGKRWP